MGAGGARRLFAIIPALPGRPGLGVGVGRGLVKSSETISRRPCGQIVTAKTQVMIDAVTQKRGKKPFRVIWWNLPYFEDPLLEFIDAQVQPVGPKYRRCRGRWFVA